MNIQETIKKTISEATDILRQKGKLAGFENIDFEIEHPEEKAYGDYSANIALKASKMLKKNPRDLAEKIKTEILANDKGKYFKKWRPAWQYLILKLVWPAGVFLARAGEKLRKNKINN